MKMRHVLRMLYRFFIIIIAFLKSKPDPFRD